MKGGQGLCEKDAGCIAPGSSEHLPGCQVQLLADYIPAGGVEAVEWWQKRVVGFLLSFSDQKSKIE